MAENPTAERRSRRTRSCPFLQDRGFAAERAPLSGAAGGSYLADLTIPLLAVDRVAEVKGACPWLSAALRLARSSATC